MFNPLSAFDSAEAHSVAEAFELQQIARNFRKEVDHREAFAAYCQWYYQTAAENQKASASMQKKPDLFGWFWRRRH
ncbi:MAG: hypothetical protein HC873_10085 [Leptolyngbyaceae cyanobacterium SL_1_1]|nr:hypothetical protein [Leptolyngbyaceae cyanobacterium SL_1_1]